VGFSFFFLYSIAFFCSFFLFRAFDCTDWEGWVSLRYY
jgi:hypothetical protein